MQYRTDAEEEQETSGWSKRRIVIPAIAFVAVLGAISIAAGSARGGWGGRSTGLGEGK